MRIGRGRTPPSGSSTSPSGSSKPAASRLQLRRCRRRAGHHQGEPALPLSWQGELGEALIARYTVRFTDALDAIDTAAPDGAASSRLPRTSLRCAARPTHVPVRDGCGRLPNAPNRNARRRRRVLRRQRSMARKGARPGPTQRRAPLLRTARDTARMIVSAIQGAMLVAQPRHDHQRFHATATRLLASIATPAPASA